MIDIDDIQIIEKSATDTHFQLLYDDKTYQVSCKMDIWDMDMIVEVTGNGIKPGECGWICSSIGYTRLDSRRALRSYFNRKEEENERRTKNDV